MTIRYEKLKTELRKNTKCWLVTGAAGFIGSHLVQQLLSLGQKVRGLDNFATGHKRNLNQVQQIAGDLFAKNFEFIEGDVVDQKIVQKALDHCDVVLHQAALGSVPRSIDDPLTTNKANVEGFLNVLHCAQRAGAKRVVFASSSSVYGDALASPKKESDVGMPLSPYAVSKRTDELYAAAFAHLYKFPVVGLRYFNVFGPRQDPTGDYAAVIPRWLAAVKSGKSGLIFGDGLTSRDFCYVDNVVQANILAAHADEVSWGKNFNVALGDETTLNDLYRLICEAFQKALALNNSALFQPEYKAFRAGDVRHSRADISLAKDLLGFSPEVRVADGIKKTVEAFLKSSQDLC